MNERTFQEPRTEEERQLCRACGLPMSGGECQRCGWMPGLKTKRKETRVTLGLDPSINSPGFSVFHDQELVKWGVRRTWRGKKPSDQTRLRQLLRDVEGLCSEHEPDTVVIEDYQFRTRDVTDRNKDYLKKMIWSIGICIVGAPSRCEVVLVRPLEWKGRKSKAATMAEARIAYRIEGALNDNAADAIMIAHHYIKGGAKLYWPRRDTTTVLTQEE